VNNENNEKKWPKVAIIILNWNGWKDTIECLESVLRNSYPNYQVIVVDNGSTDGSVEEIKAWADGKKQASTPEVSHLLYTLSHPPVKKPIPYIYYTQREVEGGGDLPLEEKVTREWQKQRKSNGRTMNPSSDYPLLLIQINENLGFAGGNNVGIKSILNDLEVKYFLLLNNDTVVNEGFLTSGIRFMETDKNVGIYTGKILFYNEPRKLWAAGGHINLFLGSFGGIGFKQHDKGQFEDNKEVDYIPGTMMLIRRTVFENVGYLPECYFATGEETEFSMNASRKGFKLIYNPTSVIFHKVGISSDRSLKYRYNSWRTRLLFIERNFYKPFQKIWFFIFIILCRLNFIFRKKDFRGLDIFNLAFHDHKKRGIVRESDLKNAEKILEEKWRKN
jgi:GT2 family glycosyltransferase